MTELRTRIIGHGEAKPEDLLANPLNWRIHPRHQRAALNDVLEQIGWVQHVMVNKTTGNLVDGHLRVDLAMERGEPTVPVEYVELSEDEERVVLASLDPLASLAVPDAGNLELLLTELSINGDELQGMLDDLRKSAVVSSLIAAEPDPRAFWPSIHVQVPPELLKRWKDLMASQGVAQEWEAVERVIDKAAP